MKYKVIISSRISRQVYKFYETYSLSSFTKVTFLYEIRFIKDDDFSVSMLISLYFIHLECTGKIQTSILFMITKKMFIIVEDNLPYNFFKYLKNVLE